MNDAFANLRAALRAFGAAVDQAVGLRAAIEYVDRRRWLKRPLQLIAMAYVLGTIGMTLLGYGPRHP